MGFFCCELCIKENCEKRKDDKRAIHLWSYVGACGLKPILKEDKKVSE